jgi:hypothetical protein
MQNFLSGCGLMALLILWGLFRRLKEIEKENSQRQIYGLPLIFGLNNDYDREV